MARYERMDELAGFLADTFGIVAEVPHENRSVRYPVDHYFRTPVVRRRVEDYYAIDFELFGYE